MTGYDKLARLLGQHEDLAMFRTFSALRMKVLLFMQAELLHLENDLRLEADFDLVENAAEAKKLNVYWKKLNDCGNRDVGSEQKELVRSACTKLKEFYQALRETAQIKALPKPQLCDSDYLMEWLDRPTGGDCFLDGIEADAYRPEFVHDLITVSQTYKENDRLAQSISNTILPYYHHLIGERFTRPSSGPDDAKSWHYEPKVFTIIADTICVLLSASVPTVSMFCLYFLKDQIDRLGFITFMSFFCAAIMMFVVRGRRVDVFAATMAFAAVQVVFLSGQNFVV